MNSYFAPLEWLVFFALWRMAYETANTGRTSPQLKSYLIEKDSQEMIAGSREKEWTERAIKRYAAAQEKKWQHWKEAMFERAE